MLDLVGLRRIFERLGTPEAGRRLIEEARRNAPVREVQSNSNNVITRFHSRKMGRMVDTESRSVEYPAAIMYEHDPGILEFYAQPMRLDLILQEEGKPKPSRIQHTPDFLLIRENGFWVEEWREEGRLQRLQKKYPGRFIKDASGWRFPIVEEYLSSLGVSYRLRSDQEHPRVYIQNLSFLADYLHESCSPVEKPVLEAIHRAFQDQAGLPLLHLIQRGEKGEWKTFTPDHVYKAIADRDLFFDLQTKVEDLPNQQRTFQHLTPRAVEEILTRSKWLEMAETDPKSVPCSRRTLQRYRRMMKTAESEEPNPQIALASRIADRGNRNRKIPQRLLELIEEVAQEHYNAPRNINKSAAYRYFVAACNKEGILPCSRVTFNRELESHASIRQRKGKRMAYQEGSIVWYLVASEPIHGVRPFQYVHIDHTQLDVLLVGSETRKPLGKPWLTLALDAESRHVAGFYLSFDPPSYRSCMMLLRDLVRRHGQMPAMLVLDNGKEFHSAALTSVCELHGCSLRFRPGGKPRMSISSAEYWKRERGRIAWFDLTRISGLRRVRRLPIDRLGLSMVSEALKSITFGSGTMAWPAWTFEKSLLKSAWIPGTQVRPSC